MGTFVFVAIVLSLCYAGYRYGKRLGSRKGYAAGRGKRRW